MRRPHAGPLVDLAQLPRPQRVFRVSEAPPPPPPSPVLTKREAAAYLRVSERTVETLIAKGALASFTIGTLVRIRRTDIEAFVAERLRSTTP
ncbi:MAG TPA: helix-turn-helix domain-containing protein [Tepidisphaeraceae bacterium]|jgi:excisionase family DNA binding protein